MRLRSALALLSLALPAAARADGAFPDSMSIFLPPARPHEILVGTTFGLLVSSDDGGRWELVCEESITNFGETVTSYQMGPPPQSPLYAVSSNQLLTSTDAGCSWTAATGTWQKPFITDAFPDPRDGSHVFALAAVVMGNDLLSSLFVSQDGARSFGDAVFHGRRGLLLTGVESAAADARTVYVTEYGRGDQGLQSLIARSDDAGKTFTETSLLMGLGGGEPRLAAIDPADPRTIYFRVIERDGDKLGISRDGGATAAVALSVGDDMSGFLRRPDGTLLVAARLSPGFRSTDGGRTFAAWPEGLRLRGMGERNGVLYAVGDDSPEGFGVGASADGGKTWKPLLRFKDLCGVRACSQRVTDACKDAWDRLVNQVGNSGVCAAAGGGAVDGGAPGVTAPDAGTSDARPPVSTPPADGGCSLGGGAGTGGALLLLALLGQAARRLRRAARPRRLR